MKKLFVIFFCWWCFFDLGISKFEGDLSILWETCKWRSKILEVSLNIELLIQPNYLQLQHLILKYYVLW